MKFIIPAALVFLAACSAPVVEVPVEEVVEPAVETPVEEVAEPVVEPVI